MTDKEKLAFEMIKTAKELLSKDERIKVKILKWKGTGEDEFYKKGDKGVLVMKKNNFIYIPKSGKASKEEGMFYSESFKGLDVDDSDGLIMINGKGKSLMFKRT